MPTPTKSPLRPSRAALNSRKRPINTPRLTQAGEDMTMEESTARNTISNCFRPSDANVMLDDTPLTIPRSQLQLLQLHINELQKDVQTAKADTRHYIREAQCLTHDKEKINSKTRKLYDAINLAKSQCKKRLGKRMTGMDNQLIWERMKNRDLREELVRERETAHGSAVHENGRSEAPSKSAFKASEGGGQQREMVNKKRKMGGKDESVEECTGSIKRIRLDERFESRGSRATAEVTVGIMDVEGSADPTIEDMVEEDLRQSFAKVDQSYNELTRELEEYGKSR